MPALPVLMYHHVSPSPGLITVSPEAFRAQMAWLARNGWRTASADDLARFLDGEPLPPKSVMLTFDDGYLDNYVHAHPVLAEFGFSAVLFVVTGWLGDGPMRAHAGSGQPVPDAPNHKACMAAVREGRTDDVMLRWSEAETMRAAGTFEFHSHTHTHTRWDKQMAPGAERDAALASDLAQSKRLLGARLGTASAHLCWPQGYYDGDYIRVAREAGFSFLYTTEKGINTPRGDVSRIKRVVVKDRADGWFGRRVKLYASSFWGGLYSRLRGD